MNGLTADTSGEIVKLIFSGRKIEAIKIYREATNCSLKDAKNYVDRMELLLKKQEITPDSSQYDLSGNAPDDHEIEQLLLEGRKIQAIKIHREQTGSGLRESKEYVEEIEARLKREWRLK